MPYSQKEKRKTIREMDKAIKKTNLKVGHMELKKIEMDEEIRIGLNKELDGLKEKTDDEELKKKIESIRERLTG